MAKNHHVPFMPPDIDVPMTGSNQIKDLEPDMLVDPPELNWENFVKLCAMVTTIVDQRKDRLEKIDKQLNVIRNELTELEDADHVARNVEELQKHVNKLARIVSAYRVEASEINL